MKHYAIKVLHHLQHTFPTCSQYAHHKWALPIYGVNHQYAPDHITIPF